MTEVPRYDRRASLFGLVGTGVVATGFTAAAAVTRPYPDAELRQAWSEYLEAYRAVEASKDEEGERDADRQDEMNRCEDAVWDAPALTVEGLLIKMRMICIRASCCVTILDHYAFGKPVPDKPDWDRLEKHDETEWLVWDHLRETETLLNGREA